MTRLSASTLVFWENRNYSGLHINWCASTVPPCRPRQGQAPVQENQVIGLNMLFYINEIEERSHAKPRSAGRAKADTGADTGDLKSPANADHARRCSSDAAKLRGDAADWRLWVALWTFATPSGARRRQCSIASVRRRLIRTCRVEQCSGPQSPIHPSQPHGIDQGIKPRPGQKRVATAECPHLDPQRRP